MIYKTLFFFLLILNALHSQKKIGDKEYPEILWGKDQEFSNDFPLGSFVSEPNDFILCRGQRFLGDPPNSSGSFEFQGEVVQNSGSWNNKAIQIVLEQGTNGWKEALLRLEAGVRYDPHFFPFRYNLGRVYTMLLDFDKAMIQFEYARNIIPDYYRTYLHLGMLSERAKEPVYAESNYKLAYKKNPFLTESLIRLADLSLRAGSRNQAFLYLKKAESISEESPDVQLGFAKLSLDRGNAFIAYKILKKTSLSTDDGKMKLYDKKFHFVFAEASSKIGDYEKAEEEYTKLLSFPNDPFFATTSYKVIQRRRDIAKKFSEAKRTQSDDSESYRPQEGLE